MAVIGFESWTPAERNGVTASAWRAPNCASLAVRFAPFHSLLSYNNWTNFRLLGKHPKLAGMDELGSFYREAEALGLVIVRQMSSASFQEYFPGQTRSILLLGSSGERFFARFQAATHAGVDPLDTYTKEIVSDLVRRRIPDALGVYFPFEEPFLPFQRLASAAGLGVAGPLGILISGVYGPWFALRACVALPSSAQGSGLDLKGLGEICARCEAPCISSCPAKAATREGLLVSACGAARHGGQCQDRCIAREACPIGVGWRYPDDAIRFHHKGASAFFPKEQASQEPDPR